MQIPTEKQQLLHQLVEDLSRIRGVKAVVLGGSYARGTQNANSDLDIGIYYSQSDPFSIEDIRRVAAGVSNQDTPVVTDFYVWGAWVNGGAWIHTRAGKVDFLYRNLDQVQQAIQDARQGIIHLDYHQQPAYGFYSVIYLAETRVCLPLYDPDGAIAKLKEQVAVYPPQLKEKTVSSYLWMGEFTLINAVGFAAKGDVYSTAGSLTRTAAYLTQALFALNETYFITDKTAQQEIERFQLAPKEYSSKLQSILGRIGQTPDELSSSVKELHTLWQAVVDLTGGTYQPAFRL